MTVRAADIVAASRLSRPGFDDRGVRIIPMPKILEMVIGRGVHAMTIGNTIMVHGDHYAAVVSGDAPLLVAHELVHVDQWRQNGSAIFLARYLLDYARLRLIGLDHNQAYRGIGFEHAAFKEAKGMVEII